jgi:hypothetical protein
VEIETAKIFRPGKTTNRFIDFSRLRPKISETIPGEALKLSANFSISNAKDNAMYNVVSKCTYSNTIDHSSGSFKSHAYGETKEAYVPCMVSRGDKGI